MLGHVTLLTEIAPRGNISQVVTIAVAKVRQTDFYPAAVLVIRPTVASQAFVEFPVDFITFD